MNLKLKRKEYRADGIFGEITDANGNFLFISLEHAYPVEGALAAKVPNGTYVCKRGVHELHDGVSFETFEVIVPNHTGILFHIGNYGSDSEGCFLVASGMGNTLAGGKMVTDSKNAFIKFMTLQNSINEFYVTIE